MQPPAQSVAISTVRASCSGPSGRYVLLYTLFQDLWSFLHDLVTHKKNLDA